MSQTAFDSLRKEQKQMLEAYSNFIANSNSTIEKTEGGSVMYDGGDFFGEE